MLAPMELPVQPETMSLEMAGLVAMEFKAALVVSVRMALMVPPETTEALETLVAQVAQAPTAGRAVMALPEALALTVKPVKLARTVEMEWTEQTPHQAESAKPAVPVAMVPSAGEGPMVESAATAVMPVTVEPVEQAVLAASVASAESVALVESEGLAETVA